MEEIEITLEDLADIPEGARVLIDTRDDISYTYGTMPGAVNYPDLMAEAQAGRLPKEKKLVLFCMHGSQSYGLAEDLREMGYDACSLREGYSAWLRKNLAREDRSLEIEDSIRRVRRFRENLMTPFTKAIRTYELLQPGDRVAVCISGGKDSMLMAKLFQELQRHKKFPFELRFLVMDPGYNELNRLMIETNAAALGIPITIFESDIFDIVDNIPKSPCYLCARMRRGHLYKQAQELGCNKIALGHHYDDVIETILMGMLWSGQFQTMMPRVHSKNFPGMELIRPMTLIREDEIKAWRDYHGLHFIQCACHFTDTCSSCREDGAPVSKRMETKQLIKKLHETNPDIEAHLFNSARCVNLDTVLGYKLHGEEHSFLENFE
ncbi:MAG: ATPase [Clostridia bacterium]|nr:ATPase [Clostridia bacterium]MBQ9212274.1 ATPase [Clostridia bacterium]